MPTVTLNYDPTTGTYNQTHTNDARQPPRGAPRQSTQTTTAPRLLNFAEPTKPAPINFTSPNPLPDLTKLKPSQPTPSSVPLPDLTKLRSPVPEAAKPYVPAARGAITLATKGGTVAGVIPAVGLGVTAVQIWDHNIKLAKKILDLSQPEPKAKELDYEPINNANVDGKEYLVDHDYYDGNNLIGKYTDRALGPVKGMRIFWYNPPPEGGDYEKQILCKGLLGTHERPEDLGYHKELEWRALFKGGYPRTLSVDNVEARPADGTVEASQVMPELQRKPLQQTLNLPEFAEAPPKFKIALDWKPAPEPDTRAAQQANPQNNVKPFTLKIPTNQPIDITNPDGVPVRIPATSGEREIKFTPATATQPATTTVSSSNQQPITLTTPGSSPVTISIPGFQPITVNPKTGQTQGTTTPNIAQPRSFVPTPTPKTQPQPQPQPQPTTDPLTDIKKRLEDLTAIAGMIPAIARNTTPQKIAEDVCSITKPGGCIDDAIKRGNNDLLGQLNATGQGADLLLGADTNARVKNLEDKLGAHEYPMVLPEYLLDDFLDKQVVVPNQARYNEWLLKQIDALVGLFPIKIERTDEEGQKQTLSFENIAEAIAELTGLLAQIAFDADTAVNVATRATGEALGAKAAALQTGSYVKAIIDHMGFQTQHMSIDVPVSVTPGATGADGKLQESELKDFLKPSTQKTISIKNTDPVDMRLVLRRILEDGEILRAALYKPLKPIATENSLTGDAIKADKKAEKKRIDDAWEAFKLRYEGHTAGTKIDIDDGTNTTP